MSSSSTRLRIRAKRWCDVAYNFLIGEDGLVYEGRGWRNVGSHTYGYNDLSLGIAFIGTFVERSPNEAAWKALKCLLDFSVKVGYLSPDYLVVAHSDVSNLVSPGEPIRSEISKWPNYRHN
ncbi:recognition 3-like [Podarcis lilfordi]|uniref:Recognition 3-like n=1 Tax=Podarcis lilfordi TaxID=74358 RepID=A0AA35PUA7_9SAUR|nr:recognition 3-like [Podarcis lilfordi]